MNITPLKQLDYVSVRDIAKKLNISSYLVYNSLRRINAKPIFKKNRTHYYDVKLIDKVAKERSNNIYSRCYVVSTYDKLKSEF